MPPPERETSREREREEEEKRCEALPPPREWPRASLFNSLSCECMTRRACLAFFEGKRAKRRAQGGRLVAFQSSPCSLRKETRRRVEKSDKRERRGEREKINSRMKLTLVFPKPTRTRSRLDAQRAQLEAQRSTPW